jgi:hypothetical protein
MMSHLSPVTFLWPFLRPSKLISLFRITVLICSLAYGHLPAPPPTPGMWLPEGRGLPIHSWLSYLGLEQSGHWAELP